MYILLPYAKKKKEVRNLVDEAFSYGALKTAVTGLNFAGQDGVFSQLSKGMNQVTKLESKFSIVAMTQLMKDGKVSNRKALDYMFEGMAKQLDLVRVAQGYQSLQAMKTALQAENGVNASSFLKALSSGFQSLTAIDATANINKEKAILIDVVNGESWGIQQETADRKVSSGTTLSENIHRMPDMFNFECNFVEGLNYTREEFDYQIDQVCKKNIPISIVVDSPIFGDTQINNLVITSYQPNRNSAVSGFDFTISFKQIKVGSYETKNIVIESLGLAQVATPNIVENPVDDNVNEKLGYDKNKGLIENVVSISSGGLL